MAMADLIPTGRTSLVTHGSTQLQIQTEYAYRPSPRITTTVQRSGQVVQKIELSLEKPISTLEEKDLMEVTIRKQHAEVIDIISRGSQRIQIPAELMNDQPPQRAPLPKVSEEKPYPETDPKPAMMERLETLPGTHRIYRLDNEGNFINAAISREFQRAFKPIFKSLRELIAVFSEIPGIGLTRESGVYEIERNRVYLVSTGLEIYFFCIDRPDYSVDYEVQLRALLK